MNDLRVFEATLKQCVERQWKCYILGEVALGICALGFTWYAMALLASLVSWTTCDLGFLDLLVAWSAPVIPLSELSRVASSYFCSTEDAPQHHQCGLYYLRALTIWFVAALLVHVTRVLSLPGHPHEYIVGVNSVLQPGFGWRYDAALDRLFRERAPSSTLQTRKVASLPDEKS